MGVFCKTSKNGSRMWYYDFMHEGIRYRGIGGSTKTLAQRTLEKKRNDVIIEGNCVYKKPENPKFDTFVQTFLERRKHLRSFGREVSASKHFIRYFKSKTLLSITPANIMDYMSYRISQGVVKSTVNREMRCLRRMFNLAIKWHATNRNPVKDVDFFEEPPGRTRFLSEVEAVRLLTAASPHLKPIIMTALNTGMRLGEILSLKWSQVHINNVVDPSIEIILTKNYKKRFVPLNEAMVDLLNSLMDRESEFVFLSTKGEPLNSIKKPFNNAVKKAGIDDFRFHDLRHTFASHYLMSGGDLMSLKDILGHSSMKMVMRYAHLADSYRRKMINNINGKFTFATYLPPEPKTPKTA